MYGVSCNDELVCDSRVIDGCADNELYSSVVQLLLARLVLRQVLVAAHAGVGACRPARTTSTPHAVRAMVELILASTRRAHGARERVITT